MPTVLRCLLVTFLLSLSLHAHAAVSDAQTAWRLLDYIAVDYASAVADGEVADANEYREMVEFSASARERIEALPVSPGRPQLLEQANSLQQAIATHRSPEDVAIIARGLAAAILAAYPVPLAPSALPDLAVAAGQYQLQCASCHGTTGAGDGPASVGLDPPAIDFTDRSRARERSLFALYQVIEQGLEGTSMVSYAHLPADDRWGLSFYIGQFAYPESLVAEGEALWNNDPQLQAEFSDLASLTQQTPGALAARIGEEPAAAITAYLRRHPGAVQGSAAVEGQLALARSRLAESLAAYAAGEHDKARDLALSAYLDGFEPVEPLLAARDRALMTRIEVAMGELRSRIGRAASVDDVRQQVATVDALFADAERALAPELANNASAFIGAFTILVREGLEALLILIAMVAFLRKANRTEVMPYVHGGWISALLAGVVTWFVATYVVSISGASRELTEGFAALFAAVVLLFVGIWMHGKSQAGVWQRYINEKLSHALSKRSAWFLFVLSFVVVYREVFETVLFYIALWSQGNGMAILAGGGLGVIALAAVATAMLRYSRRLPIGQFFALSSMLIAVVAVVLAGKGVAALQEAGWVSVSGLSIPQVALLGIYPTLQTVLAQLATLTVLVAGFWFNRRPQVVKPA